MNLPGRELASIGLATSTQWRSMSVSANAHDNKATLSATLLVKLSVISASAFLICITFLETIFFGKKGSRIAVERNNQSAVSGSRSAKT